MGKSTDRSRIASWTLAVLSGVSACSSHGSDDSHDSTTGTGASGASAADSSSSASSAGAAAQQGGSNTGTAASTGTAGTPEAGATSAVDGSGGACLGSSLLTALGKQRLMIGVSTDNTTAAEAPFDLHYIYISGGVFDSAAPCTTCDATCTAAGKSCASGGCGWWGCYDSPPGAYASDFISSCAGFTPAAIPMFTYYEIFQTAQGTFSNFQQGTPEVTQAAVSTSLMTRYFADWRFLLQQIGQGVAFLHIEPDFWGFARQAGSATALPAAVASANPTDCGSLPNTIAGMGQCMISMVRKYAPHAFVGLSASAWNIATNTDKSVDPTTDATQAASFLAACGQSSADFIVVETSDRDAGYYQSIGQDTWWDPTNTNLPDFDQDITWVQALTEALGTPALYWQTPLGNATTTYEDNRVDYFFGGNAAQVDSGPPVMVPSHWSQLAAAHVIGAAFGAGTTGQTTPATDGNNLINKTKAYVAAGGQALCQ
jgi:hypothetical protein